MPRGKRKDAGAGVAEAKKAKTGLHAGDALPELKELRDEADNVVQLHDVVKSTGVVIFCFPKANTPGCTKQAMAFSEHYDDFQKAGYTVYGMSADKPKSLASWKEKQGLRYSLLSAPDEVLKALGVKKGRGVQRSHMVIAKGGTFKDVSLGVTPAASAADALAAVAGAEAVPAPEAAEATQEKKEKEEEETAQADAAPAAEEKKDEPQAMEGVTAANGEAAAAEHKEPAKAGAAAAAPVPTPPAAEAAPTTNGLAPSAPEPTPGNTGAIHEAAPKAAVEGETGTAADTAYTAGAPAAAPAAGDSAAEPLAMAEPVAAPATGEAAADEPAAAVEAGAAPDKAVEAAGGVAAS